MVKDKPTYQYVRQCNDGKWSILNNESEIVAFFDKSHKLPALFDTREEAVKFARSCGCIENKPKGEQPHNPNVPTGVLLSIYSMKWNNL